MPKKIEAQGNKKWRMVIDYRALNGKTVGDAYPLPNITDILDQLGGAMYCSILDLASRFHQISMDPRIKTAFSTPFAHLEFTRMPFGLKSAPATFQRLMDHVLAGLQGIELFVYMDDIVIYGKSLKDHSNKLRAIVGRLKEAGLTLQPEKNHFLKKQIAYLGHVISEDGVKTEVQQSTFEKLRDIICSGPLLQYPNFTKPFVVTIDASNYALGAILSQGEIGQDLPIAYASRTLNDAEIKYFTTEKELLAIVFVVQHFHPYLYGRKSILVTDHRPLIRLHNLKDPNSRLGRWKIKLSEYEYEIVYKPGKINANADALSRNPYDKKIKAERSRGLLPLIIVLELALIPARA